MYIICFEIGLSNAKSIKASYVPWTCCSHSFIMFTHSPLKCYSQNRLLYARTTSIYFFSISINLKMQCSEIFQNTGGKAVKIILKNPINILNWAIFLQYSLFSADAVGNIWTSDSFSIPSHGPAWLCWTLEMFISHMGHKVHMILDLIVPE